MFRSARRPCKEACDGVGSSPSSADSRDRDCILGNLMKKLPRGKRLCCLPLMVSLSIKSQSKKLSMKQ